MTDGGAVVTPPAGGRERRLKLFLIASLAVNLLVIGAIAGTALTWKRHGGRHGPMRGEDYGLMTFTRTLPAERRNEIRKTLRQQRASLKPLWTGIADARREAADVLASEPFSKDRLKEAVDRITEAESRLKSAGRDMFLETAAGLEPAERRQLSQWWRTKAERMTRRSERKAKEDEADK